MYSVAARSLIRHFFIAAPAFFLCLVQVGSAQTGHPLLGARGGTDQAFHSYISAAEFTRVAPAIDLPSQALLPRAYLPPTSIDSISPHSLGMEERSWELPAETDEVALPDSVSVTFRDINLPATYNMLHRGLMRRPQPTQDESTDDLGDDDVRVKEGYHWSGLFAQSLFFNVVENAFRAASDDQIRTLLAKKPFWHDYVASIRHFDMRRWNDGDDFLVNYVGHPMQGAVSGFIEIQNDPTGRQLEISANRAYWMSRFKAFLWATAYSTHSEISPLGEAGIGNEGGWNYPIDCHSRCKEPGTHWKNTNNTGWVDFIITPTVGTLWLLAEDTLDRYVSDRVQGGDRSRMFPKILRGTLNPSRTMANALRFKSPWYRDFQHSRDLESSYGVHFLRSGESTRRAQDFRRFAIMPYFIAMPFGTADHRCTGCIRNPGAGVEADIALTQWIAASFAVSKQQTAIQTGSASSGSTVNAGLGVRLIRARPTNTLSLVVRTGVLTERTPLPIESIHRQYYSGPSESSITHTATTIMLSNDHKLSNVVAFRSSFGATIVRYRDPAPIPREIHKPVYPSSLSADSFSNRTDWTCQVGPVFHF
jgi:hypothetical protein